jgi:transposase-like protein
VSDLKGRHFAGEIVLWAVRWYCRYGISYRDLEQMMAERGVSVDHSTIYRGSRHRTGAGFTLSGQIKNLRGSQAFQPASV